MQRWEMCVVVRIIELGVQEVLYVVSIVASGVAGMAPMIKTCRCSLPQRTLDFLTWYTLVIQHKSR